MNDEIKSPQDDFRLKLSQFLVSFARLQEYEGKSCPVMEISKQMEGYFRRAINNGMIERFDIGALDNSEIFGIKIKVMKTIYDYC